MKNSYMYQYIIKWKYNLKMIQILQHLMKYLDTYWIWVDCTISIPYEKFHSCDFTKNIWMRFFIQTIIIMFEKKVCWETTFVWKPTINRLEAFVSKFILHVYQNLRWNWKTTPTINQNVLKKYILLPKVAPPKCVFTQIHNFEILGVSFSMKFSLDYILHSIATKFSRPMSIPLKPLQMFIGMKAFWKLSTPIALNLYFQPFCFC